ncbi:type II secretion system protein [Vibrio chagasii]|uniref:type II secretion system protein n=1 Tax=Vibrio chagasii TaxID=170679 RepID=UPI0022847469|nr:type II secretion system protein [Vibrio chagasii]MCY9828825.1 type II secretion system protein [Vibrio chagasii]
MYRIKNDVNSFYNRILYLEQQIHAFATTQYQNGWGVNTFSLFPQTLSDLEGDYIPECSKSDSQAGKCWRYDETPWGEVQGYQRVGVPVGAAYPDFYRAELTIPLQDTGLESYHLERNITLQMFSQLPNVVFDEPNNTIILRIERPDKAFAYDGLVKRSGDDSTLLGDWDIGGLFALVNAKDYSISGVDNRGINQQISVARGLLESKYVLNGETVDKPTCPAHMTPHIKLSIARTNIQQTHTLTGSTIPTATERSRDWVVYVQSRVKNNDTGKSEWNKDATVLALTGCQ